MPQLPVTDQKPDESSAMIVLKLVININTNISEHTAMPGDEGDFNAGIMYKTEVEAAEYLNSLNNQELVLFFTDFHFPLNQRKFIIFSK